MDTLSLLAIMTGDCHETENSIHHRCHPHVLMGLGSTFATTTILGSLGYDANPASIHMARAVVGAMLGLAVITWLARNSSLSQARNALVVGLFLVFFLGAVVDLRGIMAGTLGPSGWISGVVPWLILSILTATAGRSAMSES